MDTAEGRGKNEPLGALTTKWHAKGAAFQPRMEYKIRTCYVKRINLMPYPGQGWMPPPNKLSRDSPSNLKKKLIVSNDHYFYSLFVPKLF